MKSGATVVAGTGPHDACTADEAWWVQQSRSSVVANDAGPARDVKAMAWQRVIATGTHILTMARMTGGVPAPGWGSQRRSAVGGTYISGFATKALLYVTPRHAL